VFTSDDWLVTRMRVISDEFWIAGETLMPSDEGNRGNRFGDHRLILDLTAAQVGKLAHEVRR
jgi:hypothetical protein